jgi:hypothetical protein
VPILLEIAIAAGTGVLLPGVRRSPELAGAGDTAWLVLSRHAT